MSVVVGVSSLDELLGDCIRMSRALGIDGSDPGSTSTGLGEKLTHLQDVVAHSMPPDRIELHAFLISIRNAIMHRGSRERSVRVAWNRLGDSTREWWEEAAGRSFPFNGDDQTLALDDRELLATLKAFDRIALSVAHSMRVSIPGEKWAQLVVAEFRVVQPGKAGDRYWGRRRVKKHASTWWRLDLSDEDVSAALALPTSSQIRELVAV